MREKYKNERKRIFKINTDIEEQLEQYFPEEIILSQKRLTTRNHISYISLEEGKNCLKCASCGIALYIPGKEYLAEGLEHCKMMKDIPFCHSIPYSESSGTV